MSRSAVVVMRWAGRGEHSLSHSQEPCTCGIMRTEVVRHVQASIWHARAVQAHGDVQHHP